jgi:hypothetical protein
LSVAFKESPRAGRSLSESPRAGRSTRWVELYDDPEVIGESCAEESNGTGDAVLESKGGLVIRPGLSGVEELYDGERTSDLEFFLASAFLFLGTSCSLNPSVDCDAAGEACWLRDRSWPTDGDSLEDSLRFRSVSTKLSDGCLPFSWYAMCGLLGCLSADADRDLFSLSISLWFPPALLK